jgi:predicted nucleotidyltransferase
MTILYLFGSRARGDHQPDSDYDVFIDTVEGDIPSDMDELEQTLDILEPFSVEKGGRLDLFFLYGDDLVSAYDPDERRIIQDKWAFRAFQQSARMVSLDWLIKELS